MAYTPPNFNQGVLVWAPGTTPAGGPPLFAAFGQLYVPKDAALIADFGATIWTADALVVEWRFAGPFIVTLPPPILGAIIGHTDTALLAWYHKIVGWEWKHAGFPNEYIATWCVQCDNAGAFPDAGR